MLITVLLHIEWDEDLFKKLNKIIKNLNNNHPEIIPEDYEGYIPEFNS